MATAERHVDGAAWLRRMALPITAVLLLTQAVVVALWPAAHVLMIDLEVYRAGGEHVLRGLPLYEHGLVLDAPFVYPPFAAIAFVPLALLPLPLVKLLWTALDAVLLVFVVRRCAALVGLRADARIVALLSAVLLALDPIRTTLYLGQINVVLLALVLADLTGRRGGLRGVGVGLAAAVKLTPLLFVVYLLLTGRVRAAGTALATFAAATGLGFLVAPADSRAYWLGGTFTAADRISPAAATSNHALSGLLARAGVPHGAYLLAAAVLAVGGLGVAVLAHRRGEELLGLTICGLVAAAAAPFAWSHHFVWFGPLAVVLARPALAGSRPAALALAGLLLVTIAWVTGLPGPGVGPIPSTGLVSLQPDVYLAAVIAVLAGTTRWLHARPPGP